MAAIARMPSQKHANAASPKATSQCLSIQSQIVTKPTLRKISGPSIPFRNYFEPPPGAAPGTFQFITLGALLVS